jgi:hypothetical protein
MKHIPARSYTNRLNRSKSSPPQETWGKKQRLKTLAFVEYLVVIFQSHLSENKALIQLLETPLTT